MPAEALFDLLREKGVDKLVSTPAIAFSDFNGWTHDNVSLLVREISAQLPRYSEAARSNFNFIATSSLGGAPYPCAAPDCRIAKVKSMARFAALYADRVLLPDPFDYYVHLDKFSKDMRYQILIYIRVLFELRDLIECGLVGFAESRHHHFCAKCYGELLGKTKGEYLELLKGLRSFVEAQYVDNVTFVLKSEYNRIYVEERGPEMLLDHGSSIHYLTKPSKKTRDSVKNGPITLTKGEVRQRRILSPHIDRLIDDMLRQNYYSTFFNVNYLTQRELDFKVIEHINGATGHTTKSGSLYRAFSHEVPLIENVSSSSLVKLRIKEAEAFSVYRDALSEALMQSNRTNPLHFDELFEDIVKPQLNKIRFAVNNSRKLLRQSLLDDIIVGSGFIGLSIFGGILPPNIGQIIAALGGIHFGHNLFSKVSSLIRDPPEARENRFYFLWKALRSKQH